MPIEDWPSGANGCSDCRQCGFGGVQFVAVVVASSAMVAVDSPAAETIDCWQWQ